MELTLVKEHPDGSATYKFDMTDDERLQLLNLGIITALERGIESAKKYRDDTLYDDADEVQNGEANSSL